MSPKRSIQYDQNDFWPYCMFDANQAPILCGDSHYLQMDQNELPLDPRHLGVPSGMPKMIYEPIACSAQTMHLFGVEINTFSK
jgi:hypothetical protein